MDLLQPRRAYYRANSDDPYSRDAIELSSINTDTGDSKSQHSTYKTNVDAKHDYLEIPVSEYGNDYHLRASDPDRLPLLQPSTTARWFSGWRTGAYSAACLALASLVINSAAAAWLKHHPNADSNLVEVFNGSCNAVSRMDIWVHLLINAISTLLLGGSNYCMQCLCAPTRAEVDRAHAKGRYLDIAVPSYHNLSSISWSRHLMWWILGLSSIPLHLMYNSAFYSSLSTNDYLTYFVTPDFLTGGNASYNLPSNAYLHVSWVSPEDIQTQIANNQTHKFEQLDPLGCIQAYAQVLLADRRNLVFVVKNNTASSNSTVIDYQEYSFDINVNIPSQVYTPFDWICRSDPDIATKITAPPSDASGHAPPCDTYVDRIEAIANQWTPWGHEIDYCLSEVIEEKCSFNGNLPIITVVIIANAIKVVVMLIVAYRLTGEPLITLGDAIVSFLEVPDETTRDVCYLTRDQVSEYVEANEHRNLESKQRIWKGIEKIDAKNRVKSLKVLRWSKAASNRRWVLTIGLIVAAVISVVGFFAGAISAISVTNASIASLGFGTVHVSAIISGWSIDEIGNPATQILAAIFIANLPQAILSFLYLNLNGLLTSMWTALEWSHFATERKALRVSTPKGSQRSTHFLQLPYKIAIPLMTVSGILHWLVSQSIFLAVVAEYGTLDGELINPTKIASCGFSPIAMLIVIVLGVLIIIGCWIIGRMKYDPSMPLAGSSSVAISAACHRPEWDVDASVNPVQWGVIPGSAEVNGVGHCCFTSGRVEPVQEGEQYAGMTLKLGVGLSGIFGS